MKRPAFIWPLGALVLVLLFNLVLTPGFFALKVQDGRLFGSTIDVLNRSVPVGLLALGMTLVIATAGVDLSVGAVMAITGSVVASLVARPDGSLLNGVPTGGHVPAVLLTGLAAAVVCGLFNGLLVAVFRLQPIVATLLLMVAGRGVAQLITNGQIVTFENQAVQSLGSGAWLGLPVPLWIFLAAFGVFAVLSRGTALGLFIEAVGSNPVAARLSGLSVSGIRTTVYALSGLCAGVAGLITTADVKAADANNAGLYLELDAILAVAIGGTAMAGGRFSLIGTVIGVVLMQAVSTTVFTRGVPPEATLVLKAVIVVAVCLLQSEAFRQKSVRRTA
ncbi:MAG: ABC transporter permease [Armatimonadetes bacterium]|nr:ABC transporter permease [Armatimonadota bacterium]